MLSSPSPPARKRWEGNVVSHVCQSICSGLGPYDHIRTRPNFLKKNGKHKSFLWGPWYPCSELLVIFPLGFKARMGSLICAHSLRFTSGVTPANLMTAEPNSSRYPWATTLPIDPCQLGLTCSNLFIWGSPASLSE